MINIQILFEIMQEAAKEASNNKFHRGFSSVNTSIGNIECMAQMERDRSFNPIFKHRFYLDKKIIKKDKLIELME